MDSPPTLADLRSAQERIRPLIHRTPVLTSARLDAAAGASLFFKCENLQKAGAFKARGACNAVFALTEAEAQRGVATHSSGNHAAALARAAALRGIAAHIVMPTNSPKPKQAAVAGYGGKITFCAPTQAAREQACAAIIAATGATMVHPYDNYAVIAGQASAALELLEQVEALDSVICPVGGGGLLSGTALAVKALRPAVRVIGAEPAQADDAAASFQAGQIVARPANTIADGLRTLLGARNFPIIQRHVDAIATVSEAGIIAAMRNLWETAKIVVEPSGAVPLGVIHEHAEMFAGQRVGVILSGGNVDLDALPWVAR